MIRFDWDLRMEKWHSKCNRLYILTKILELGIRRYESTWDLWTSHATQLYERCHTSEWVTRRRVRAHCRAFTFLDFLARVAFLENRCEYRVAKMHRMPYLYRSLPAKEPCTSWLFCGKRPATQGILCIFATMYPKDTGWNNFTLPANSFFLSFLLFPRYESTSRPMGTEGAFERINGSFARNRRFFQCQNMSLLKDYGARLQE